MSQELNQSVAQVYAPALFQLAEERGQTALVREELEAIAAVVAAEPDFARFLATPAIKAERKQAAVERIFGDRVSDLVLDFLGVLARRGRLLFLGEIARRYGELDDARQGRRRGVLVTAVALSPQDQVRLGEQLGRQLGLQLLLEFRVDPGLIGGTVLILGDRVLDYSVRTQLARFRRAYDGAARQPAPAEN